MGFAWMEYTLDELFPWKIQRVKLSTVPKYYILPSNNFVFLDDITSASPLATEKWVFQWLNFSSGPVVHIFYVIPLRDNTK